MQTGQQAAADAQRGDRDPGWAITPYRLIQPSLSLRSGRGWEFRGIFVGSIPDRNEVKVRSYLIQAPTRIVQLFVRITPVVPFFIHSCVGDSHYALHVVISAG